MKVFMTYNRLSEEYESIVCFRTVQACKRFYNVYFKNPEANIIKGDFQIYEIGYYNSDTGDITINERQIWKICDLNDEDIYSNTEEDKK